MDCQHNTKSGHLLATAGVANQRNVSMNPKQIHNILKVYFSKIQFKIQGNEDVQYCITIYVLKDDDTQNQCALEACRNGGDSNSINYEKRPEFTMEHGFLESDFYDSGVNKSSVSDNIPLSSMSNMTLSAHNTTNSFDPNACVQEAIDTKQYIDIELYHECVSFLRKAGEDDARLTKISQLQEGEKGAARPEKSHCMFYPCTIIIFFFYLVSARSCALSCFGYVFDLWCF